MDLQTGPLLTVQWLAPMLDAALPAAEAARGAHILLESAQETLARFPTLADTWREGGFGALVVLPLLTGGRVIGTIGLSFPEDRPFGPGARAFLRLVGPGGTAGGGVTWS